MSKFEFPAFLKLEKGNSDPAKAAFLADVDATMSKAGDRISQFGEKGQRDLDQALTLRPAAKSAFVSDMESALAQVNAKVQDFSQSARRNLDSALSMRPTASGGLNLDVAGAREAASIQMQRAQVAQQLAAATLQAAHAEGEFSQATRLSIAAAKQLATDELAAANAARVQADAAETLQRALDQAGLASQRFGAANDNAGRATASQRQGLMQLGYQLGDAATMFSLGSNASQIFASQLGQTVQAVQLMTGGTSRLAGFLGGPWGIALSTAAIVATPFIGKLWETYNAANAATGALEGLIKKQRQAQAEKNTVPNAQKDVDALLKRRDELQADIAKRGVRNPATGQLQFVYKQTQELAAVNKQIAEGRQALDNERASAVSLDRIMGDIAGKRLQDAFAVGKQTKAKVAKVKADKDETDTIAELAKAYRELVKDAEDAGKAAAAILGKATDKDTGKLWAGIADRQADALGKLTATADANAQWNAELAETVNMLATIGGAGSALGKIGEIFAGLSGGNFRGLGGAAGLLGKTVASAQWVTVDGDGNRMVRQLGDEFASVLDDVFGSKGSFSKLLEGAGIGAAANNVFLGSNGSSAGGAIGGALGEKLGEKFLSKGLESVAKGLGTFAGPLGSIAGGLIGGALGSVFKKTTSGFAVISNRGVTSGGNNADLAKGAANTGDSIAAKLTSIADRLGGNVGDYAVSIGTRSSGWIRVSASGSSDVASKNFYKSPDAIYNGKDAEEAARIALLNAIQDGAIQGVRAGAQRLLKAGKDLDRQLQRALDFEGVFSDLKAYRDPVGSALDTLNREFTRLQDVFKEAGASAAEYADLEALYGIKRADAVESANEKVLGSLKDLQKSLTVDNDTLSLRDRNSAAMAVYNPLAERVKAGDATAFDAFTQAAQDLLDIQRQLYGSTSAFFATSDQVKQITDGAITGKTAISDAATASDSPFSQLASQQQATTSAIDNQTSALIDALGGRLDALNDNTIAVFKQLVANGASDSSASAALAALPSRGFF